MLFERKKESALTGETKVVYRDEKDSIQLVATAQGVSVISTNFTIHEMTDLQSFAKTMSLAWADHADLRKALREKLMGGASSH